MKLETCSTACFATIKRQAYIQGRQLKTSFRSSQEIWENPESQDRTASVAVFITQTFNLLTQATAITEMQGHHHLTNVTLPLNFRHNQIYSKLFQGRPLSLDQDHNQVGAMISIDCWPHRPSHKTNNWTSRSKQMNISNRSISSRQRRSSRPWLSLLANSVIMQSLSKVLSTRMAACRKS